MNRWHWALWAAITVGCSSTVVHPTRVHETQAKQHWPDATLAELERGRGMYLERCSACHALVLPHEQDADRWQHLVHWMAPRAGLSARDERAVARYLRVVRELGDGDATPPADSNVEGTQ